ncbi:MAG: LuxR C-terminal-related transcriptional regulator [Actinomycetota bacterium]|nr:LuxR C-terminal-related transcriptional regulator [Actinomycetota bacterium]
MSMGRLAVQDRQPFYREALTAVLAATSGLEAARPCVTAAELLSVSEDQDLAAVVLEADGVGWDVDSLITELQAHHEDVRIVGTSPTSRVRRLVGAVPTLPRSAAPEEMLALLVPGVCVPEPDYLLCVRRHDDRFLLSDRELRILALVSSGLTLTQVATHLGVSVKAAERAKQVSFRKLGAQSQAQAISIAVREGLLVGSER